METLPRRWIVSTGFSFEFFPFWQSRHGATAPAAGADRIKQGNQHQLSDLKADKARCQGLPIFPENVQFTDITTLSSRSIRRRRQPIWLNHSRTRRFCEKLAVSCNKPIHPRVVCRMKP
jgi:hypothetical protein